MSLNFSENDLQYFNPEEYFTYGKGSHANAGFNSYTDLGLVVGKMTKPIMSQVQESTQDVPGMYGNLFMGNDYGELTFTIPVTLMAFDRTSYNLICENLRAMFTMDVSDPGVQYPIVFGDRPNVKYYGHWGQMTDPTFITANDWQARATLTFICSQPYGYLPQENVKLEYPNQPISPSGNAKTYPIYTIYLKQNVYGVGFTDSQGGYVATGYNVDQFNTNDEGDKIDNKMPIDTEEDPTMLSDWITGKNNVMQAKHFQIDGDQAGVMGQRDGGGITPAPVNHTDYNNYSGNPKTKQVLNYGNPQPKDANGNPKPRKNFYGPLAIHPQFANPTDDWQLMVNLWNQKSNDDPSSERAMGHNDIYLLDENGQRRGRIWIHDWMKGAMPRVGFSLGKNDKDEVDMINSNDHPGDSNDPNGDAGPITIDGYNMQVNRPSKQFTIYSLYDYKVTVAQTKKAKAAVNNYNIQQTNKKNAKIRRQKKKKAEQQAEYNRTHNKRKRRHNYKKGRKSSKGKIHRRKKKK